MSFRIAAFYKFATLPAIQDLRTRLLDMLRSHGAKGTILLAHEGINGTIAATGGSLAQALMDIKLMTGIGDFDVKFSDAPEMPFKRLKVKLKKEIVTIGDVAADPTRLVGEYVEPKDWNSLISNPDVIVIDARNSYEHQIGTFKGAIDPHTDNFSEFPDYVRRQLKDKTTVKIAMFCTGGIRCEKASSFMRHEGFEKVYHLKGGILNYLEKVPRVQSLWQGACFVFDERVAVEHGLAVADYTLCRGCLMPVSAGDRASSSYEEGVSCPACAKKLTEAQKASNRERQRQFILAERRGMRHLGPVEG